MAKCTGKNLSKSYVLLSPGGKANTVDAQEFWKIAMDPQHPQNHLEMGYLVSRFDFEKDWGQREMHPHGDEIVFCISGSMDLVIGTKAEEYIYSLNPGEFQLIPKGHWHTARVKSPCSALFLTWGYETQNRPIKD